MNAIYENLYVSQALHSLLFSPICAKYGLTPAEILVLLFLANNCQYDTATAIAAKLKLAKSHVSVSVRNLEERGYLKGNYEGHNRKTIHLQVCDTASNVVADARNMQAQFISILEQGFSEEECAVLQEYLQRITDNMNTYLKNLSLERRTGKPSLHRSSL